MAAVGTWAVFSSTYWARQRRGAALARKVRANVGIVVKAKKQSKAMRLSCWKIERESYRTSGVLTHCCDAGKLLSLLRAFPPNEPTKKRFVSDMVAWSGKAGDYPNGDPELHHVAGTLFAEGKASLYRFYIRSESNSNLSAICRRRAIRC